MAVATQKMKKELDVIGMDCFNTVNGNGCCNEVDETSGEANLSISFQYRKR